MFDEKFNAEITSLSAGVKEEREIVKIKVEVMMDYPSIKEWNKEVYALLTMFENPPFKEMKAKYSSSYGWKCNYEKKYDEVDMFNQDKETESSFRKFTLSDVTIKIKDGNVPVIVFSIEIPSEWANIENLAGHLKQDIILSFEKEIEEESVSEQVESEV